MEGVFRFKQFDVVHRNNAMKVGTDGVLLGAWCSVEDAVDILDVGAGTGLISLMVAQRNASAHIDAVEIDKAAAEEARFNFLHSKWSNRLLAIHADFALYSCQSNKTYDLVVSNPPFFTNGELSSVEQRARARHADSLPFPLLFSNVRNLLSTKGMFAIIAPADIQQLIEHEAGEQNFWLRRRTNVRTTASKPIRRHLWLFSNCPVDPVVDDLVLRNPDNSYSNDYINLTKDFYLHL